MINAIRRPKQLHPTGSTVHTAGVIMQDMGVIIHLGLQDTLTALMIVLTSINLLETVETTPELVSDYAVLSVGFQTQKLHPIALHYLHRAERMIPLVAMRHTVAFANMHRSLGYVYVFRGEWHKAIRSNEISHKIFEEVGDVARLISVVINQCVTQGLVGEWAMSRALRQKVVDQAEQSYNLRAMTWGLVGIGQMALYQGDLDAAGKAFARRESITERIDQPGNFNPFWSYRAALRWRYGDLDGAADALRHTLEEVGTKIILDGAHDLYSIFNMGEVALGLLESDPHNAEWRETAKHVLGHLKEYSDRYPIGVPRHLLYRGLYKQLTRNPRRAQQLWAQARKQAEVLGLPYEEALAYFYCGKYAPTHSSQRAAYLRQAQEIFTRLGANWDLTRLPE